MKCQVKNTQHIAKLWNLPSQDTVDVKSLRILKKQLDKFMGEKFIQGLLSTKCVWATEWWRLEEYVREISVYTVCASN